MMAIFLMCEFYYVWTICDIKLYGRLSEEEKELVGDTVEKGELMGEWIWSKYKSHLNRNPS